MAQYFLSSEGNQVSAAPGKIGDKSVGAGNAGLRLLDSCYDDVAYARYLLNSRLPADRNVKQKVNWKDQQSGVSLLHCFSYSDLAQPLKLLLENNADPNIRNQNDQTPLHWCGKMNATSCAKQLLDFKADVNAVDNSGSTALHYAAHLGHIEMIMLLLDRGANVQLLDKDHKSAMDLSAEGRSNAAKAAYIIFTRHYQRLGLPINKAVKQKQSFANQEYYRSNSNNLPVSSPPGSPTTSPGKERARPTSPPRTMLDELRSASKHVDGDTSSNQVISKTAVSPERTLSAAKQRPSSPPAFHFNVQNYRPVDKPAGSQTRTSPSRAHAADNGGKSGNKRYTSPYRATKENSASNPAVMSKLLSAMPANPNPDLNRPVSRSLLHIPTQKDSSSKDEGDGNEVDESIVQVVEDVAKKLFPNESVGSAKGQFSTPGKRFASASEIVSGSVPSNSAPALDPHASSHKIGHNSSAVNVATLTPFAAPATPSNTATKVIKTFADSAFPSANVVPFLPNPQTMDYLDVIVCIEHCVDCYTHSDQSLRHDPKKYIQNAVQTIYSMIHSLVEDKLKIKVYALRSPHLNSKRVGAFEVTIAVCVPEIVETVIEPKAAPTNVGTSFPSFASMMTPDPKRVYDLKPKWATYKLFSKLANKSWPHPKAMEQKATGFIEVTLRETVSAIKDVFADLSDDATLIVGSHSHRPTILSEIVFGEYKHAELTKGMSKGIEESYAAWQERMKLPMQLVRDPLDVDLPDLFPAHALQHAHGNAASAAGGEAVGSDGHPKGPYLDRRLASMLSTEDFERLTLKHFFVYDNKGR